jgi:calcium-dependent protein kinase
MPAEPLLPRCLETRDTTPQGSVVARLQRFATYSHLKQLVLRMITEDMRRQGSTPTLASALQVRP